MRKLLALAFAATLAGTGACARGATSSQSATPAVATLVNVRNNRFYDMDVFVVRSGAGTPTRLGTVSGNSSARFTLPAYLVGAGTTLRFYADPIGPSGVRMSEDLNVQPGDNVQLDITP
jgi:hypothetical protein